MSRALLATLVLAAAGLAACGQKEVEALRAEIVDLHETRVAVSALERARKEADAAAAAVEESRAERDEAKAALERAERQLAQLEAAYQRALERNESLRVGIETAQQAIAAAAERGPELELEIMKIQSRATWARDQAALLANQLVAPDQPWAVERRVRSYEEFLTRIQSEYADDPRLAEVVNGSGVAGVSAAEPGDVAGDAQVARAVATANWVSDHFTEVYDLAPLEEKETP